MFIGADFLPFELLKAVRNTQIRSGFLKSGCLFGYELEQSLFWGKPAESCRLLPSVAKQGRISILRTLGRR